MKTNYYLLNQLKIELFRETDSYAKMFVTTVIKSSFLVNFKSL